MAGASKFHHTGHFRAGQFLWILGRPKGGWEGAIFVDFGCHIGVMIYPNSPRMANVPQITDSGAMNGHRVPGQGGTPEPGGAPHGGIGCPQVRYTGAGRGQLWGGLGGHRKFTVF